MEERCEGGVDPDTAPSNKVDAAIVGHECGGTAANVWRQPANDSANGSDEKPSARVDTDQHEPDDRVASSLLRHHRSSSDTTGRTALLTLSM